MDFHFAHRGLMNMGLKPVTLPDSLNIVSDNMKKDGITTPTNYPCPSFCYALRSPAHRASSRGARQWSTPRKPQDIPASCYHLQDEISLPSTMSARGQ